MKRIKAMIPALISGLFLFGGTAQASEPIKYEKQLIYFDTVISLSFYAEENGEELMQHCMEMCQDYENIFSRTKEDSELYAVNHRKENRVQVSDEIIELVAVGLEYHEKSEGMFDITVAPLSDLWNFKSKDAKVPPEKDIKDALQKVDGNGIHIEGNELVFDSDDIMIDLGALVKGYAADNMKEYLVSEGVESGLLNLGGNVLTIGTKPDGKEWNIGIQKPFASRDTTSTIVKVKDQTVVSSGIYERCFEQDGKLYHHILNPFTGYPVDNDIEEISIICDSSLLGDALSTTCLSVGMDKAEVLLEKAGAKAIAILSDEAEPVYIGEGWEEK